MQVFIIGSPLATAMTLDKRRLLKQIIETRQILAALDGARAWRNHPCVLQYREHRRWLEHYRDCLYFYSRGHYLMADIESSYADDLCRPEWHSQEYFDQMKRRLYTKDPEYYAKWAHLGTSYTNWYYVDGEWRMYEYGRRLTAN